MVKRGLKCDVFESQAKSVSKTGQNVSHFGAFPRADWRIKGEWISRFGWVYSIGFLIWPKSYSNQAPGIMFSLQLLEARSRSSGNIFGIGKKWSKVHGPHFLSFELSGVGLVTAWYYINVINIYHVYQRCSNQYLLEKSKNENNIENGKISTQSTMNMKLANVYLCLHKYTILQ